MIAALRHCDALLHGTLQFDPRSRLPRPWWWMPLITLALAPVYGGVMGTYGLQSPERLWQVAFAAMKMPVLLMATTLLCLPGFFVFNTLLGLRDDFHDAVQAVFAGQAGMSVALAALAPLTRFWYFSDDSYRAAVIFNVAMMALATAAGQIVMLRYYRILIARHRLHRLALVAWVALYAFVGTQMGWMLRPFIGSPDMHVRFFREEAFTNAYVNVFHLFFGG